MINYSLNAIFGAHDDESGLFSFGMNKKEKRDFIAAVAGVKNAMEAVRVAKDGVDSLTNVKKVEIQQNMNAMEDAQTGGLSVYARAR